MGKPRSPLRDARQSARVPHPISGLRNSRYEIGLAVLVLAGLTLAVYAPVRGFRFVTYDDAWFVTENAAVLSGFTWRSVRWAWENAYLGTGGPLTWFSHMADVQMFGLDAGMHHLTSLAWHLANTMLLFALLFRMTRRLAECAVVAALFAVHPLHVESVAWVAQRKDVLSTFFWLLGTWAYVSYAGERRAATYAAVVMCHACGLLSKPMVATLPFTLLLLDVWPLGRLPLDRWDWARMRRLVGEKAPLLVLSTLALWATLLTQRQVGAVLDDEVIPLAARLGNAVVSYMEYGRLFFWPSGLVAYYPYEPHLPAWQVVVCFVLLLTATLGALALVRRVPAVPVGWAWYLGTLVPTIGIVQVGGHRMADRFTYVPSIGFFIVIVWGVAAAVRRWRVPRAGWATLTVLIVIALAAAARAQVWVWRDGLTLWQHAVGVSPGNARAQANLGTSLLEAGRTAEAVSAYRAALESDPGDPKVRRNLGLALVKIGDHDRALAELREAVRIDSRYAAAHESLANLLADDGDTAGALFHYGEAIRLDANAGLPRMNFAVTLARNGRVGEALAYAIEAVRLEPARADWHFTLALMYEDVGRRQDAVRELETVLRLSPSHPEAQRELAALRGR